MMAVRSLQTQPMTLEHLLETRTREGEAFTRLQLALFQLNGRLNETLESLAQADALTLAAGKPVTLAADLKLQADFEHGLQKVFFNQQLDDLFVDFVLDPWIIRFRSSKENIIQNGMRKDVIGFPIK